MTQFLGNLLKLLVCNHDKFGAQIQKYVKDLLGHECSPHLYSRLFDQIKVHLDKFFDNAGQQVKTQIPYCEYYSL